MTPIEYMHQKNALVKRVTGHTLIPEDQIVDVKVVELMPSEVLSDINCPYCRVYRGIIDCTGCPMDEAHNNCSDMNSTYQLCDAAWNAHASQSDKNELLALAIKYNESNKGITSTKPTNSHLQHTPTRNNPTTHPLVSVSTTYT